MASSGLNNTSVPLPTHKVYFTYFFPPFPQLFFSSVLTVTDASFELILADCLWEAKQPQMSAVVLSDFLRQSDKFGTDSESYSMNTFRTSLEIVQHDSFLCEYMRFYHISSTITSPLKKTDSSHFVYHSLSFCKSNDCLYKNWTSVKLLHCERVKVALGLMITAQRSWELKKSISQT